MRLRERMNAMNWRDCKPVKEAEVKLSISEKVKAVWTGLSVVLWYAALILVFGRPVLYLVIQTFRFAAFSWLSIQDWCCGGNLNMIISILPLWSHCTAIEAVLL